ncbi:MAG: zinc ribbon domain-containing protein [Planctomycetota bacterium]
MEQTLRKLKELQEMNQKIEQLEHDAEMLDVDVRNAERELADKRRRHEETHNQRIEAVKRADSLELKLEEAEQENERLRTQLNSITDQREYDAIKHTILNHEADIERWEDEALDLLNKIDELSKREQELQQAVEEAEQNLREVEEEVGRQKEELADRTEMLRHKRQVLRREIDSDVLSSYDRLSTESRNNPLAEVRDRVCGGCHTRITKQSYNLLLRGRDIVYCHSCGRMLMLPESETV